MGSRSIRTRVQGQSGPGFRVDSTTVQGPIGLGFRLNLDLGSGLIWTRVQGRLCWSRTRGLWVEVRSRGLTRLMTALGI